MHLNKTWLQSLWTLMRTKYSEGCKSPGVGCHKWNVSSLSDTGVRVDPGNNSTRITSQYNLFSHWNFDIVMNCSKINILLTHVVCRKKRRIAKAPTCTGASQINGSSASSVTIHGEIVVPASCYHNPKCEHDWSLWITFDIQSKKTSMFR